MLMEERYPLCSLKIYIPIGLKKMATKLKINEKKATRTHKHTRVKSTFARYNTQHKTHHVKKQRTPKLRKYPICLYLDLRDYTITYICNRKQRKKAYIIHLYNNTHIRAIYIYNTHCRDPPCCLFLKKKKNRAS